MTPLSQSPSVNPKLILAGNSGTVPERDFYQPSTKHQMMEFLVEEQYQVPQIGFQTLCRIYAEAL